MSKHETAMTEGFWLSQAHGMFFPEYPLVRRAADRGARLVDGLILPDEPHGSGSWRDYASLAGRHVILVQTKIGRMGMYLMGQALFSARLTLASGAASVRSILLCHQSDGALLPLLDPFPEVEVWLSDPNDPRICKRIIALFLHHDAQTAKSAKAPPSAPVYKWPIQPKDTAPLGAVGAQAGMV